MPVFSSWEAAFRQISADTGGRVNNTNKLQDALAAAAASEDIYYVLTFLPAEGKDRQRVLKVGVQRPELRVSFSRKLTLGEIFPLKISALEWKDGVLRIALNEFQRLYSDSGLRGRLRIGVQAKTKDGNPLAAELEVQPQEIAVTV
jgi:hypothetical protein